MGRTEILGNERGSELLECIDLSQLIRNAGRDDSEEEEMRGTIADRFIDESDGNAPSPQPKEAEHLPMRTGAPPPEANGSTFSRTGAASDAAQSGAGSGGKR